MEGTSHGGVHMLEFYSKLDDFLWINWLEWDSIDIDKSILSNLSSGMKKHLEAVIEKAGLTIDC